MAVITFLYIFQNRVSNITLPYFINRILKVARTLADIENHENIQLQHLLEAVQYRTLDRKLLM